MTRRLVLAPSAYAPSLGGVEELTAKLARTLSSDGHPVLVSTMRWPKSLPQYERVEGVDVSRRVFRTADTPGVRGLLARCAALVLTRQLIAEYRRFAPEIIHIQCVSHAAAYRARAARALGIPLVVTLQGELTMDASDVFGRSPHLRSCLRDLLKNADAVTACSAATLHEAEGWFGRSLGDRGHVIYNGVDVEEFRDAAPMDHPRPYVFALGRHVRQKGFDVLIDAFASLAASRAGDLDLVIAGDGAETESLRSQVARLGLSERVHLVGRTDRATTTRWFAGAAVFVLPSRHEPFGIVNVEAMAAGTPVIATAVGGVPEFVHDGENGIVIPPEDAGAMAHAITRVLDDTALRDRLVANAKLTAEQFRWQNIAAQYEQIYDSVRHHPGRPAPTGAATP
ncbi:MAG: glycosyltransferase family 4 protein [Actinobacteria bacterium]|nr:glycosyltransferase family 4 protein [Actinomycetota bacterium]